MRRSPRASDSEHRASDARCAGGSSRCSRRCRADGQSRSSSAPRPLMRGPRFHGWSTDYRCDCRSVRRPGFAGVATIGGCHQSVCPPASRSTKVVRSWNTVCATNLPEPCASLAVGSQPPRSRETFAVAPRPCRDQRERFFARRRVCSRVSRARSNAASASAPWPFARQGAPSPIAEISTSHARDACRGFVACVTSTSKRWIANPNRSRAAVFSFTCPTQNSPRSRCRPRTTTSGCLSFMVNLLELSGQTYAEIRRVNSGHKSPPRESERGSNVTATTMDGCYRSAHGRSGRHDVVNQQERSIDPG